MSDDFPTPEEIINGTYKPKAVPMAKPGKPVGPPKSDEDKTIYVPAHLKLNEEQQKAISLILLGETFLLIAMRPTYGDPEQPKVATGCDYFTAVSGDRDTLLANKECMPEAIDLLYQRKGLV